MSAQLPERIGRFIVTRVLGKGGFGLVVCAEDDDLGGSVAIKILDQAWCTDQEIRKRFIDEARLLRSVSNDHLITVHDIGELADGRPYFVLDLADRGTLADRLVNLSGVDAISLRAIVNALSQSLAALHNAGFVHRDVTPKNLLIKKMGSAGRVVERSAHSVVRAGLIAADERIVLGDLGLAKNVVASSEATVMGGTPLFRSPEQMRIGSDISEATDVFAATAVLWNVVTGTLPPGNSPQDSTTVMPQEEWKAFMSKGMATHPLDRFSDMIAWHTSAMAAISACEDQAPVSVLARSRADICPYQGLASFQPEDANRFFGRDELLVELVDRLRNRLVLVVAGASGSGKSSLVRAGLIAAIRSGALPNSDRWSVLLFAPGANPIEELKYQINKALGHLQIQDSRLPEANSNQRWRQVTETISETAGGALLCIDQFEELFTFDHGGCVVTDFLDALQSMVEPVESRVHLVLTIRADFYAKASRYPWLARIINENQILVGPMSRAELREAIVMPAKTAGLKLEDSLVDAVLDEAGESTGSLPLVSHALVETWKRRTGKRMTIDNYRSAGGVAGAIGLSAETLFNEMLTPVEQSAARRLILRLVSPGEGVADTRRPIAISDLRGDTQPEVMSTVADSLIDARLLTVDRNTIQFAHEAIISSWPRLVGWINESREDLRIHQRIERAAAEWVESSRNADLLYHGTPLSAARDWQKNSGQDLNVLETEFLDTAVERENAELLLARRADERAKSQRRLAFATLTVLTIAAVASSVVAYVAFHRASNNEQAANQRLAQALASQAVELVDQNPGLAMALAAEVMARSERPPVEARIALANAAISLASTPYTLASMPIGVGDAMTVAVSPDAEIIATGNRDGSIAFWTAKGQPMGLPIKAHGGAVEEIVFSPSGARMLSAGISGRALSWDLSNLTTIPEPTVLADLNSILWSVAISPNADLIATASEDGMIRLFDVSDSNEPEILVDLDRDFLTVQFSPDGQYLFAGNGRGEVWSWIVSTREQYLAPVPAHHSDLWEIVFHPRKPLFVTASSDGRVRLWNLETGLLVAEPFTGIATDVRGVQISDDGWLIAGDEQGRLVFWDIENATYLGASATRHDSRIIDMSLQQTDTLLVSLGLDHVMRTWRRSNEGPSHQVTFQKDGAFGLAISADGHRFATGDGAGRVRVFSSQTDQPIGLPLSLSTHRLWAITLDRRGQFVAAGDQKGTIGLWEVETGNLIARVMNTHDGAISTVAFHPDGEVLVSAGGDGSVRQWHAKTLEPIATSMSGHAGGVTRLAFSPDGRQLAVSDRAGDVRIWEFHSGELLQHWLVDDNTIWSLAWSLDGTQIAVAHADEAVTLWEVSTGQLLHTMTPHPGGATDVAFLADGNTLVSTSRDGTLRLWDTELGLGIGKPMGSSGETQWRLAGNRTANWFLSSRSNGAVERWDILDMDVVCRRSAWNPDEQRRYLGEGESPQACMKSE